MNLQMLMEGASKDGRDSLHPVEGTRAEARTPPDGARRIGPAPRCREAPRGGSRWRARAGGGTLAVGHTSAIHK